MRADCRSNTTQEGYLYTSFTYHLYLLDSKMQVMFKEKEIYFTDIDEIQGRICLVSKTL